MKWNSVDNEALQWIVGPPGTGKSCTALAFAYALNSSVWDVLWIGFSPPDDAFLCVWLHEEEKMMCRVAVQDVQLLQQLVDSLSTTRSTLVFLDGYAASNHEMEEARRICKKWHCLDKALRRLIYVCSMSSVNKKYRMELYPAISRHTPDVQMETEGTESSVVQLTSNPPSSAPAERLLTEMSYDLESWRLEDYQEAIMDNDEFFESVKDMFDPFPSEMDDPMEGRAKLLEEKFCIAGGSVRLMFAVSVNTAMTSLDKAIRELASKSQRLLGVSARGAINRLRAEYHHGANRQETCFVSEYVARKFAALHGPELLQQVATLCDVNPAMDGYLFEAWFFASLKAWGVKWCYLRKFINKDGEFARAETTFFDPKHESIAVSLENAIWLAPVKWNQGGYDAVFIDKAECIVRFIRVTRAQNHKFDPDYFIKLLVTLAMHADMVGVQLKAVVLYFVVPMGRLKTFTCPVSSQDFGTSVIQHTSVAGSIAKATRSHSYGMFRKCKSKVKVVGVNYAKVKRARQMNG